MGYILLLLFFLIWLNVRKIRKAIFFLAKEQGYPSSLRTQILDIITDYSNERKTEKVERKQLRKEKKLHHDSDVAAHPDVDSET